MRAVLLIMIVFALSGRGWAADAQASAQELRAAHAALAGQPRGPSVLSPTRLASSQTSDRLRGELLDDVEAPLATIAAALGSPQKLCDLLFLHLNMHACRVGSNPAGPTLNVTVGAVNSTSNRFVMEYSYRVVNRSDEFVHVTLVSAGGPLGTSHYEFDVQAVSVGDRRSFLKMTYAYRAGMTARIAMDLYNKAAGRQRVGFTVTGQAGDGQPALVGGLLGSLERNLMRYYLALRAYVGVGGSASQPADRQLTDKRLHEWYRLTEQYPRQLHEVELAEYLTMKQAGPAVQ